MTKKPLNPLEDPPTASSSEEDELETSADEEEEVSSSEEDESIDPSKKFPSDSVTVRIFENKEPKFISFTIPNPTSPSHLLRVAVLDSPVHSTDFSPRVAAILVPKNRETDWIFSSESGHLQLLLNIPDISRLIMIGDNQDGGSDRRQILRPILLKTKIHELTTMKKKKKKKKKKRRHDRRGFVRRKTES